MAINSRGREFLLYFIRRVRFMVTRPGLAARFSQLRKGFSEEGYTLKPFDEYRCIFIHVPKNAGQSIRGSLFPDLQPGHIQAFTYQLIYPRRVFARYFKFAFVRNPWDRLASAYFFLKGGGAHQKDRDWAERCLSGFDSFEQFVIEGLDQDNILSWPHFRPQIEFLRGGSGSVVTDYIGRFENLEEDFRQICRRLNLERELLHINRTGAKRQPYQTYYSDTAREIAARVYHEDLNEFNYVF